MTKRIWLFISAVLSLSIVCLSFFAYRVLKNTAEENLAQNKKVQSVVHQAALKILGRDLDDLELQLQRSLSRKEALEGHFEIHPGKSGLRAIHSQIPASPLEIESEAKVPFADSLALSTDLNFYIFADDGTFISKNSKLSGDEAVLYSLSQMARTFENPHESYAKITEEGLRFLNAAPSWKTLVTDKISRVELSRVDKSNLILISLSSPRLKMALLKSILFPMLGGLGLFFIALSLLVYFQRKRRQKALAWFRQSLQGFRYGRFQTSHAPRNLFSAFDRSVMEEIEKQFSSQTPFSPYSGRWLNPALRVATWNYFRETLSLWALHEKEGYDILIGKNWFVAKIKVSKAQSIDSALRIFGRAFAQRTYLFNHYSENEILIVARAKNFEEWFESTHEALRAWTEHDSLKAGDFEYTGLLMHEGDKASTVNEILAQLEALDSGKANPESRENPLSAPLASFHSFAKTNEPLVLMNWLQLLSLPADKARHLYMIDQALQKEKVKLPPLPRTGFTRTPLSVQGSARARVL